MSNLKTLTANINKQDLILIIILILAAIIRLTLLDLRPAHHDEGVNGWFADQVKQNGCFKYDPNNYHGPLHFYLIFFFQALLGDNLWVIRLPTILISLLSIYWFFLFSPFFGRRVVTIAAIAMTLSPAYEYFGRFAIHESDLVFFLILTLWGILGLYIEGKKKYLWGLGLGIAGIILTKETYIIHLACFMLAGFSMHFIENFSSLKLDQPAKQLWVKSDLQGVIIACLTIIVLIYSGNFLYIKGIAGLYETFLTWFNTSKSGFHSKPFFYWLSLCTRYEYIALLGIIFSTKYMFSSSIALRYTSIYGLGTFLAYSIVPYKTPWCIISILWPFFFIFGEFINSLLKTKFKFLIDILCISLFIFSFFTLIRLNFINYTNHKEPYVYVQTFNDIKKLTEPINNLVKEDPTQEYSLTGNILRTDEWPLPWTLLNLTMVGYFAAGNRPSSYYTDFLFVENQRISEVEENLQKEYFTDIFQLRDSQDSSKLYLSYEKFKNLFPGRIPEFKPLPQEPMIPGRGLLARFYSNEKWSGTPIIKKNVRNINFYWEGENRILPAPFSAEFIGEINLQPNITLVLTTDDGGFLELDGEIIINDPGPHAMKSTSVMVNKSGWKKIKVGFYDVAGGAIVRLTKLTSSNTEVPIDINDLRYNTRLLK